MVDRELKRGPDDVFDLERLRELIELMKQHDLSEIDLRRDKHQIRLARMTAAAGVMMPITATSPVPTAAMSAPATPSELTSAASTQQLVIPSPMVGTYYSRPNPKAEAFVKVGDVVGPETVVCIIEAMKVFNEIQAEVSGRVVAVLAKDQDAVEFGTPLFRVEPST